MRISWKFDPFRKFFTLQYAYITYIINFMSILSFNTWQAWMHRSYSLEPVNILHLESLWLELEINLTFIKPIFHVYICFYLYLKYYKHVLVALVGGVEIIKYCTNRHKTWKFFRIWVASCTLLYTMRLPEDSVLKLIFQTSYIKRRAPH